MTKKRGGNALIVLLFKCIFLARFGWTIGKLRCEILNLTEFSQLLILVLHTHQTSHVDNLGSILKLVFFCFSHWFAFYSVNDWSLSSSCICWFARKKLHKLRPAVPDSSFNIGLAKNLLSKGNMHNQDIKREQIEICRIKRSYICRGMTF